MPVHRLGMFMMMVFIYKPNGLRRMMFNIAGTPFIFHHWFMLGSGFALAPPAEGRTLFVGWVTVPTTPTPKALVAAMNGGLSRAFFYLVLVRITSFIFELVLVGPVGYSERERYMYLSSQFLQVSFLRVRLSDAVVM